MKMIGITAGPGEKGALNSLTPFYEAAIREVGAEPVVLLPGADIARMAEELDGLLLSGGTDIAPARYGENDTASVGIVPERDELEFAMTRAMLGQGKPILGICRGAQLLNVYFGGKLYQDIEKEMGITHPVGRFHPLATMDGSEMARILGEAPTVNSRHHQAVKRIGRGLRATAFSEDGIVEAFENTSLRVYGVQFHPEELIEAQPEMKGLFQLIL